MKLCELKEILKRVYPEILLLIMIITAVIFVTYKVAADMRLEEAHKQGGYINESLRCD